ncbi:MAG: hypothetical protein MPJ82_04615, partial [Alphaproteobacteria bacterium]|nr:hypothetical protein [Alphaproteobacteria bacterium]
TVGETIMLLGTSRVVGGSGDINGDDGADVKDGDNDGAADDPSASADNTPTVKKSPVKSSDTNDNSPDSAVVNQPAAKDDTSDPVPAVPDPTGKPPVTVDAPREIRRGEVATVTVNRLGTGRGELWLMVMFEGEARLDLSGDYMPDGFEYVASGQHFLTLGADEGSSSEFSIRTFEIIGNEGPKDIKICVMSGGVSHSPGAELCGPDVSIIKTITLLGTNRVVGTGF